ncbi:MAG: hypothetical protein ACRC0X_05415 [Brevinema sp.]
MDSKRKYLWDRFYSEVVVEVLIHGAIPTLYQTTKNYSLISWIHEVRTIFEKEDLTILEQYLVNK